MGLGPVAAVSKLFARTGAGFADFDLVELNEAFACQVLGVVKEWGFEDLDRLNVNGSGISLGHPVGATGARYGNNRASRTRPTRRRKSAVDHVYRRWPGYGGRGGVCLTRFASG